MTEKIAKAIEAALFRVVFEAIRKIDGSYPNRFDDATEFALHMQCVQCVMAWYEDELFALRNALIPESERVVRHRRSAPLLSAGDESDEWSELISFFLGVAGASALVGIAALPQEAAQLLRIMTGIVDMAIQAQVKICLRELQNLADTFNGDPQSRRTGHSLKLLPQPHIDEALIKAKSERMADSFKKMMTPPHKPKKSIRPT